MSSKKLLNSKNKQIYRSNRVLLQQQLTADDYEQQLWKKYLENQKVKKSYNLMKSIIQGQRISAKDDDVPKTKYRKYLRQRQEREAMQLHAASIQEKGKQAKASENIIKGYRLIKLILAVNK